MIRRRPALLFLFAFTAALAYMAVRNELGAGLRPGSDSLTYDAFARAILTQPAWLTQYQSVRPPGYPLVLALLYAIGGGGFLLVQIVQAAAHASSVALLDLLGRRHFNGRAALPAALWLAVNPLHLDMVGKVLREPWLSLLSIAIVLALLSRRRTAGLLLAALFYTILIHFDSRFLFHFPFFALYLALAYGSVRRAVTPSILFASLVVLLSLPWFIRNVVVYDRIVLIDTRTIDTYGRNVAADDPEEGAEDDPEEGAEDDPEGSAEDDPETAIGSTGAGAPDLAAFEAKKRACWNSLLPSEREALERGIRPGRTRWEKTRFDFLEFWRIARFRPEYRPLPDARFAKRWSRAHNLTSLLFVGLLLPFFFVGSWMALRAPDPAGRVLLAWIAVHTLLHAVVHGVPRYRLSIEPFFSLLAFTAIAALLDRASSPRPARPVTDPGARSAR